MIEGKYFLCSRVLNSLLEGDDFWSGNGEGVGRSSSPWWHYTRPPFPNHGLRYLGFQCQVRIRNSVAPPTKNRGVDFMTGFHWFHCVDYKHWLRRCIWNGARWIRFSPSPWRIHRLEDEKLACESQCSGASPYWSGGAKGALILTWRSEELCFEGQQVEVLRSKMWRRESWLAEDKARSLRSLGEQRMVSPSWG